MTCHVYLIYCLTDVIWDGLITKHYMKKQGHVDVGMPCQKAHYAEITSVNKCIVKPVRKHTFSQMFSDNVRGKSLGRQAPVPLTLNNHSFTHASNAFITFKILFS